MPSEFEAAGQFGDSNDVKVIANSGASGIAAPAVLDGDEPDMSGEFGILQLIGGLIKTPDIAEDDDPIRGDVGVIYTDIPSAVMAGVSLILSANRAIELAEEQGHELDLSEPFTEALSSQKSALETLMMVANLETLNLALKDMHKSLENMGDFTLGDLADPPLELLAELPELSDEDSEKFGNELDDFLGNQ